MKRVRDRAIPKPNQMSVNPEQILHLNDYNDRRQVISPLLSMGIVKINIYMSSGSIVMKTY